MFVQVLVYLWLVEGAVGVWYALTPLIMIGLLFVAYHFIIKTLSIASASVLALLLLQIVRNHILPFLRIV